jgi:hypothetical protein
VCGWYRIQSVDVMCIMLGNTCAAALLQCTLFAGCCAVGCVVALPVLETGGRSDDSEIAMTAEPQRRMYGEQMPGEQPTVLPFTPLYQLEHLLKVSGSVAQDANKVWAELWGELKQMTTGGGMIVPEAKQGFVPACGWPEFLEKVWLLKHYLDSIQRICDREH